LNISVSNNLKNHFWTKLLGVWHCGHRIRLQNRRSRVRIPPRRKVFRSLYIAVLLSKLNLHCRSVYMFEKNKRFNNMYIFLMILPKKCKNVKFRRIWSHCCNVRVEVGRVIFRQFPSFLFKNSSSKKYQHFTSFQKSFGELIEIWKPLNTYMPL
jgi:hypothetical protein